MIVRFSLLLGIFIFTSACGTGQLNNTNEIDSLSKALTPELKEKYAAQIKIKYEQLLGNRFSGQIVISKNGQIIFEDYKVFINSIYEFRKHCLLINSYIVYFHAAAWK